MTRPAAAQDRTAAQDSVSRRITFDYRLRPVAVTAQRYPRPVYQVPFAVDYLQLGDLQRGQAGLSLEEVMRRVPGVLVHNRHNDSQGDRLVLRGIGSRAAFGVRGVKILLDGIPLTLADGQSQLNNLDMKALGGLEIIRGPASSLYGNAAGGVIIARTGDAPADPVWFKPELTVGSFGLRRLRGDIALRFGTLSHMINISHSRSDGFREYAASRRTGVNWVGRYRASAALDVTAVLNFVNAPYLLNPSSLAKEDALVRPRTVRPFVQMQGAGKRIRQLQGGITLRRRLASADLFETTVFALTRSLYNPIPGRIIDLTRDGAGIRSLYSKAVPVGGAQLRLTGGVDVELQKDRREEFENAGLPAVPAVNELKPGEILDHVQRGARLLHQNEQVLAAGPFLEASLTLRRRWTFTAGGRFDVFEFSADDHLLSDGADNSGRIRMSRFSPMAGLTLQAMPALAVYARYATSFQTPTTTELTNRPDAEGGLNAGLRPEVLRSVEAGIKGSVANWQVLFDVALFHYDIDDMLISYQVSQSEEVFFRNAGQTRNTGLEFKAEWYPAAGFRAMASYAFMRFVFDDFSIADPAAGGDGLVQLRGNRVPGVPEGHFNGGLFYEHGSGLYGEVNLQHMGSYFANDRNGPAAGAAASPADFRNGAFWVLDLRLGLRRWSRPVGLDLFIGVNNLFDERYNGAITPNAFGSRFFEPAPGRHGYVGLGFPIR